MGRTTRRLARASSVADIERLARRRLPRMVFDFVQGGAEDEDTVAANRMAFSRWALLPRVMRDVSARDQSTTVLGHPVTSPILLAPVGLTGLAEPRHRERAVAAAAARKGIAYAVSSSASTELADVAAASNGGPLWFQIYLWRDRGLTRDVLARAQSCGFSALCVGVDVPVVGRRERDARNGLTIPPRIGPRTALDVARRLSWVGRLAGAQITGDPITFANFTDHAPGRGTGASTMGAFAQAQFNPSATWADLEWLRGLWDGPMVVKGIVRADDARRCADAGAAAVVVSNHGGRQLDGAVGALDALPAVVDEVGGALEVYMDGGVRRGTDVLRAIALGARGCLVGRPYVYGLAAGGQAGVERVIDIFHQEIDTAMALLGARDLAGVDAGLLQDLASCREGRKRPAAHS
jgi:L-lactate dehydrogenase (cytochrome)